MNPVGAVGSLVDGPNACTVMVAVFCPKSMVKSWVALTTLPPRFWMRDITRKFVKTCMRVLSKTFRMIIQIPKKEAVFYP